MATINPHATAVNDFPPNVDSIAEAISGAIIIPRIEREISENLSTKGEKILLPTSLLPGNDPESSMTFRSGEYESIHRRMGSSLCNGTTHHER
jgi:hypothetical protein